MSEKPKILPYRAYEQTEWKVARELELDEEFVMLAPMGMAAFTVTEIDQNKATVQSGPMIETLLFKKEDGWYSNGVFYNPEALVNVKLVD